MKDNISLFICIFLVFSVALIPNVEASNFLLQIEEFSINQLQLANQLCVGTAIGTSYLLKEAFPGIDALESLYYMELGVSPTFLTMEHARSLKAMEKTRP